MTEENTSPEPINLDYERRRQAKDWTPEEALQFALDDIRSGKVSPGCLAVILEHELEPGSDDSPIQPVQYCSTMSSAEFLALVEVGKIQCLQEWLGPLWAGQPQS